MLLPVTETRHIRQSTFYFPYQKDSLQVEVLRIADYFDARDRWAEVVICDRNYGMEYLMTRFHERVVIPSSSLEKVDEVLRDTKPYFDEYAYRKALGDPILYPGIHFKIADDPLFLPIPTKLKDGNFSMNGLPRDHDFDTYSEAFQERIERSKSRDSAFAKLFWEDKWTIDSGGGVRDRQLDVEWSDREDGPYRRNVEEKRKAEDSSDLTHKNW